MKEEIGAHSLWTLPLVGTVHADTILTTWLAMIVALIFLGYVGRSYRAPRAGRTQTVFEGVIDYVSFPLSIAVSILPFFIQFFNFFVGTIQAFVFTLLGIVYLSLATAEDH